MTHPTNTPAIADAMEKIYALMVAAKSGAADGVLDVMVSDAAHAHVVAATEGTALAAPTSDTAAVLVATLQQYTAGALAMAAASTRAICKAA